MDDSVRGIVIFIGDVQMFRIQTPLLVVPTHEARLALGGRLQDAGLAAYREVVVAAKGLEIAHLSSSPSRA